ncbi:MAG: nitronate monooxygenase, partial [Bdellovibrionota bacterium]
MILDSEADDIVYTAAVSGIPASFMKASLEKAGIANAEGGAAEIGHKLAMADEAKAWKTVWSAGHGVSNIKDVPKVSELVDRLHREYEAARTTLTKGVTSSF